MKRLLILFFFLASNSFGATLYFIGGADWDNSAFNWSTTSGGSSCSCTPTSADDAVFDANSGGGTVTILAGAVAKNLTTTNFTGTFEAQSDFNLYGTSVILGAGMSWTNTGSTYGANLTTSNGNVTLTTNGVVVGVGIIIDRDNNANNNLLLGSNLTMGSDTYIKQAWGGFNLSNFNVITGSYWLVDNATTLTLGSGTFEVTGVDGYSVGGLSVWQVDGIVNSIIVEGTSTIKLTGTTIGEVVTFNPDVSAGAASYYYYYLVFDVANSIPTNIYSGLGGALYVQNITVVGGGNTIIFQDQANINPSEEPVMSGTAWNLNTISSDGAFLLNYSDTACWNYVNLSDCTALTASYAGCHSVNGGGNTSWTFNNCNVACPAIGRRSQAIIIH